MKDGTPRRRVGAKRRAGRRRENPASYPSLGDEEGRMSVQQLVAHRELQVIRHPSPERYRKLAEARRRLEREQGDAA